MFKKEPSVQNDQERQGYLPGRADRAAFMRLDIANTLKRFYFCERALVIAQAGWIAGTPRLDAKLALAHILWQDALTADACRIRVFELRYPNRVLDVGSDSAVVSLFEDAIHAPNDAALMLALAKVLKPAQANAYQAYLDAADALADGPSIRFMNVAVQEKVEQAARLNVLAETSLQALPENEQKAAHAWVEEVKAALEAVGGIGLDTPVDADYTLASRRQYALAEDPARDPRFHQCRFYWPDIIDASFPYGEGLLLQLRSAVSHLNEVWAVETAGAILQAYADELDWEYTMDAARWTYDEGRHMQMGFERLTRWGFEPEELPLGTYIFASAKGEPPLTRLGMLHYFETKNIGKKTDRAAAFASYEDAVSQHDMEFDWADETLHAHYGRRMIKKLQELYPSEVPAVNDINAHCDELVATVVGTATDEERHEIRAVAEAMVEKAMALAGETAHG